MLAVIPSTYNFTVNVNGFVEVPQYGVCIVEESAAIEKKLLFVVPIFISSIVTIILNTHLAIKANQVRKQIDKEITLSGQSNNITALKKKQHTIRCHRKPIITLLVIILGSTLFPIAVCTIIYLGKCSDCLPSLPPIHRLSSSLILSL